MTTEMEKFFGPPVSVYTRANAIEDRVLIDVTGEAREIGFVFPAAITISLFGEYIMPSDDLVDLGFTAAGRLKYLLLMASEVVIKKNSHHGISFEVPFLMSHNSVLALEKPKLIIVFGPGDDGSPVVTIMLPEDI